MYKKLIVYKDYNGNERKEFFYFNLTKVELSKWEVETSGGMREVLENIIKTQDRKGLVELFDDVIRRSYGEKSSDGKYFMKSEEILQRFISTEAYTTLFMELASNDAAASEFINGIMPSELLEEARKEAAKEGNDVAVIDGTNITSLA